MKPIAKKDFELNGVFYEKGDEVEVKNKEQLLKLIELGFVEPLSRKDIQNFNNSKNTNKKEELKWD